MSEGLVIAGMALVTFAIRYPVLALVGKIRLPDRAAQALKFVPPAVLAAIIAPEVLMPGDGGLSLTLANARLVAGVVAAVVIWRTKNLLLTIVVGMLTLWAWGWVIGMVAPA